MSKDRIIRCITPDGAIMACAADTSDIVYTGAKLHMTSPVATAALGRLLTAAAIMGAQLKQDDASLTLRIKGDNSETGAVIAVSDSKGNVKGYLQNPDCPTEYYSNGNVKSRRKNFFDDKNALKAFEIFVCSYDSRGRVLQERLQKYDVDGQSVILSSDELNVTKYLGEKVSETSYYKNSILRVRNFYTGQDNDERVRATYFDGGVIVRDFYRGNIKVSSTIDDGDKNEN